jgi:hypothetical protein
MKALIAVFAAASAPTGHAFAAMALINAPADGYTMFMGTSAMMVTNPLMSAKVAYGNVTTLMPHVEAVNLRLDS